MQRQEDLKADMIILQEEFGDVMTRLNEAEEELGGYRRNAKPHRSLSSDSLYDSVASELEACDSGFNTTPIISAR
jgi:hypothetical protein